MPSPSTSLSPSLLPGPLARQFSCPQPSWGVALGLAAAATVVGLAVALAPLRSAWASLVASLPTATGGSAGGSFATTAAALGIWAFVAALLVATTSTRGGARHLRRLAAAAVAGTTGIALLSWTFFGVLADPLLPMALALGGLAGRLAFERWREHAGLQLAQEQLRVRQAVSRARSDFLAEMARDMRTPVNGVVGVADLLTEAGLDGEQRRHLRAFRRSAEALTHLLEDLADLARIEAGRVELKPQDVNLPALLHELLTQIRDDADTHGLQVQLSLGAGVPRMVRGDAQRLAQALSQLLALSVRSTRQGRVAVEVRRHSREPDVLRFVVTDTSLSPVTGKLASILDPFTGAPSDSRRRGPGVGLALARSLAGLLGGRLSIRHSPGRGTTAVFSARLPAVADAPPATAAQAGPAAAGSLSASIVSVLLVDDNVSTRELIASMLDARRFTVISCGNGREALQALEIAPYDVVLMDLDMPELDGWAALRILRRREVERQLRRTPVISLGTVPLETERQRCLEAGFDDHLCKPLRKSRLLESIDRTRAGVEPAAGAVQAATRDGLRAEQRDALEVLATGGMVDVRTAVGSLGGDASLYLDAIEHLVPALGNWPARFQDALNRRDFARARQMAQDMQSILDVVAAAPCAAALGRMADALACPDDATRHGAALADLDRHLQPLMRTLQQAVEIVRAARQERTRREQGHNSAF